MISHIEKIAQQEVTPATVGRSECRVHFVSGSSVVVKEDFDTLAKQLGSIK